jgi:flagellar biosynthesis protein FlhG
MQADQFPRYLTGIPATEPRKPSPARARPRIVAVTSGKGGVGKSSIAVNLGLTLARYGRRVCILDADTGLANVNILLGLRPGRSLEHVLAGECPIENVMLEAAHGLVVIPGANGISECVNLDPARQQRLVTELSRIEGNFDYLLLDTAAGISETTLDFLSAAHQVLLVITPEPTSLTDAFSLLKLALRRHPVACEVVVNMAANFNEARSVFQRFHGAVVKYLDTDVSFLGFIQRDESMRTAVSLQHPVSLFPETDPSSRPFQRLADALEEKVPPTVDGRSFSRFWFRRFLEPAGFPAALPEQPAVNADAPPPSGRSLPSENEKAEAVAPPDRLAALRAECWQVLEEMEDARLLAQWLEGLHARYWDRFGRPAVDPQRLLDRLESDPHAHEEVLGQLRNRFRDEPPDVAPAPEAGCSAERAEDAGAVTEGVAESPAGIAIEKEAPASVGAEQRPDFGLAAHETGVPQVPVPATRGVGFGRAHAYDPRRFGAQRELAERLRRMGPEEGTLLDLIGRL